ncbi:MAG: hypothetical protein A2268_11820 [Candidatus Raymondbacteria bacterium RifOxyA12_full_50_37]|uniref:Uncharacterized protein n=1 Tax=Candidatus Raymondbacteria bacterium RIFOXYD12_FULL_49_13 TaxID=1817890 RepID=A0A1F7FLJ7_UNCRA|nr:MAG: hypothetical protein A2268_11820 [Candidatus Raymondbacteria bacterium RifOxyA12_full_50_37]OGJ98723.1 MAG: hypothetical protein A2453_08225 [Candidatus Raymondbacteria bacterium RIFOXYC2_FULL_50_21]OGK07441.1 MAG: hypothetical protein A2519_11120 [Candidatus Raymondbacteria bacterium RIFOXYD12_FULL_49_13]OGK07808.1 MAG: hypothetical protein A2487_00145 [Candidatus Raymondbacteria bacterium RifOxyC12_full_50_8]OGP43886.1 MAG: hypothetical protein A2324_05180 [Candidatus Raymondbacteria 
MPEKRKNTIPKSLIPFMNIPLQAMELTPFIPSLSKGGVGGVFQCSKMRKNTIPKVINSIYEHPVAGTGTLPPFSPSL